MKDFKNKMKRFWNLHKKSNSGFTLVELIVVIAILAILAGVAVPAYSGYVEKANKQADITLASEVEQALLLAHYNGNLTPGATVVVKYGEAGDENIVAVEEGCGTEVALAAAFGDGYADLRLKYDGWDEEIGVAGDADTMAIVKDSNFTPDSLDGLLSQLQIVVDEAAGWISKKDIFVANEEIAAIMCANGMEVSVGDSLTGNSMAAANAYVYMVSDKLAELNLVDLGNAGDDELEFIEAWATGDFSGVSSLDAASCAAAEYASIYALATYIDKETAGTENATSYTTQMNTTGDPRDVADSVLQSIKNSTDSIVTSAYGTYQNDELGYNDAVSFLAYMQGVSESSSSLLKSTDLNNNAYFTDGYIAEYVNNYIDLSDVLTANGNSGSSLAFIYTGEEVRCMPLDW